MRLIALLSLFLFIFPACSSKRYTDTRSIRTIATTSKIHNLKRAGYVTSNDCAWRLFGFSIGGGPSYSDAFDKAISLKDNSFWDGVSEEISSSTKLHEFKVKMLNNIQTSEEGWNAYFIGRKCLKLRAVAYY